MRISIASFTISTVRRKNFLESSGYLLKQNGLEWVHQKKINRPACTFQPMDPTQIKTSSHAEEFGHDESVEVWHDDLAEEPIVTVDRKNAVLGSFIAAGVLGIVVLAGSVRLFGKGAQRNIDDFMLFFIGASISCICFSAALWIRARWICVAVLDESGMIASTLSAKYEKVWGEIVGARSYSKVQTDANKTQSRLVLLLDDDRCIEAPIDHAQINLLTQILTSAKFKPDCEGQPLGLTKGLTVIFLGCIAMIIGTWWAGHAINQFNNGVFFRGGNIRVILFKIASATVVPIGGLVCLAWGLYHTIAGPVLYKPGYLARLK